MDIPPEQRDAARAFVEQASDIRRSERLRVRADVLSTIVLMAAVAINALNAVVLTSGTGRMIAVAASIALAVVAGMRIASVVERRASYRNLVSVAERTETALAFADLDDAEA